MSKTPSRVLRDMSAHNPKIFGHTLVPTTASHWLCLEQIESPLIMGLRPPKIIDYALATVVLTRPAEQSERLAADYAAAAEGDLGTNGPSGTELHRQALALCRNTPAGSMRADCAVLAAHLGRILGIEPKGKPGQTQKQPPETGAEPDPTPAG